MKSVLLAFVISLCGLAQGAVPPAETSLKMHPKIELIQELALEYTKEQEAKLQSSILRSGPLAVLQSFDPMAHKKKCNDGWGQKISCIDTACSFMDSYECDDKNEIDKVAKVCQSQWGGGCIKAACTHLDSYECDDFREIEKVGEACRGVKGGRCINTVCSYLDEYECDDLREMQRVGAVCSMKGLQPGCIKSICSKLGKFDCDDLREIEEVAKTCAGL